MTISLTATYSPEDNKLRLYASARLDAETYSKVREMGFIWAPKQDLFVKPSWTPQAEDFLLELCGEIEDEQQSHTDRAADRAERFSAYRDKRRAEAGLLADRFDNGPSAFGHQSQARAERLASRHDRFRTHAVSQWSKAQYWQERTTGVIGNALYKECPEVRRSRIKGLETELRKAEKDRDEYAINYKLWASVLSMDGIDTIDKESKAWEFVYRLANYHSNGWNYIHPRTGEKASIYSHLTNEKDPLTPRECAVEWLDGKIDPSQPEFDNTNLMRWIRHYELRLSYERAMLANEGGAASDVDMIAGGFIRIKGSEYQIHKVNRSNVSGKVVSVQVVAPGRYYLDKEVKLRTVNIERSGEGVYRAPTEEELASFLASKQEAKKEAKKAKAEKHTPQLINPTDEDAERLQSIWNEEEAKHRRNHEPSQVIRMTQAQYSERSKGSCPVCETVVVNENCTIKTGYSSDPSRYAVFKIRIMNRNSLSGTRRVVILTDKPQKPLPFDVAAEFKASCPTAESLADRIDDIAKLVNRGYGDVPDDQKQLWDDAIVAGIIWKNAGRSFGFTDLGKEMYAAKCLAERVKAPLPTATESTTV